MNTAVIKETIEEFLRKMGISFEAVEESAQSIGANTTDVPHFLVKTKESGLLIGTKGANFAALNHLLRKIVAKRLGAEKTEKGRGQFFFDVNDYSRGLAEALRSKVAILSERARSLKTNVELDPMPSHERMIVHTLLQGVPDIKTESRGDGDQRRVVIKYVSLESQSPVF